MIKSEKLPGIDVNVDRLCNLVGSIWSNSDQEFDIDDVDPITHNVFINDTKNCWSFRKKCKLEIEEVNHRFSSTSDIPNCLKPTESSKAKIRSNDSVQDKNTLNLTKKVIRSRKKQSITTLIDCDNVASLLQILAKSPIERTKEDVKQGFRMLKTMTAFSQLSDFVLNQIINIASFVTYDTDSIVFIQGEQGTAWYVILEGSVDIYISPPEFLMTSRFSQLDELLKDYSVYFSFS